MKNHSSHKIICFLFPLFFLNIIAKEKAKVAHDSNASAEESLKVESGKKEPETISPEKKALKIFQTLKGFAEDMDAVQLSFDTNHWNELKVIQPPKQGQSVKKGDLLIRLDQQKIKRQIQDLAHDLSIIDLDRNILQVELKLAESLAPLQLEELNRAEKYVKEDYERFQKNDLPFQKKTAQMNLKRSQDYLSYSEEELNQLKKMYAEDDLTEETEEIILQRARNDVEYLKFSVENARKNFDEFNKVGAPRRETAMKDFFERENLVLSALKKTSPAKLKLQQLRLKKLEQTRKELEKKKNDLEKDFKLMNLCSPIAGKLFWGTFERGKWSGMAPFKTKLQKGAILKAHEPVVTICPSKNLKVKIDIPEKNLPSIGKGVEGLIVFGSQPDVKWPAKVSSVSSTALAPGIYGATLSFTLPKETVSPEPGTACTFKYLAYENKSALMLPEKVIISDDADPEEKFVYLLTKSGKKRKRFIETGKKLGEKIEVIKGLKTHDRVLKENPKS